MFKLLHRYEQKNGEIRKNHVTKIHNKMVKQFNNFFNGLKTWSRSFVCNAFFSFFFFEAHYINISPEINMYQRQAKSCKSFSRLKLKILNYVGGREQILIEILLVGIYLKLDPFRWRGVEDCQVNDFVSEIENWCPSEVFSWGKMLRVIKFI